MIRSLGWDAWCDVCGGVFGDNVANSYTKTTLLFVLRKAGWKVIKGKHVCANCQETQ